MGNIKTNYVAGDPYLADDHNEENTQILQNKADILQNQTNIATLVAEADIRTKKLSTDFSASELVKIIEDNSTAIAAKCIGGSSTVGTPASSTLGYNLGAGICYDTNANKHVLIGETSGVVGTVSGTSISFGTKVAHGLSEGIDCCFNSADNNIVAVGRGDAVIGTVSGTSISFGTKTSYKVGTPTYIRSEGVVYIGNSKVAVVWRQGSSSTYSDGYIAIGTVSGTSISFGTPVLFTTAYVSMINVAYSADDDKVIICFSDYSDGEKGKSVIGTVSGTSISFGTIQTFETSSIVSPVTSHRGICIEYVNGIFCIGYALDNSSSNLILATLSGTTLTFGTSSLFSSETSLNITMTQVHNHLLLCYSEDTSKFVYVAIFPQTSLDFTLGTKTNIFTNSRYGCGCVYDPDADKLVAIYEDESDSVVYGVVMTLYDKTLAIGITQESGNTGESKKILFFGNISSNHAGFNIGDDIYIDDNCQLTTSGTRLLGKMIDTDELCILNPVA